MLYICYSCFIIALAFCWISKEMAMIVFVSAIISAWWINDLPVGTFFVLSLPLYVIHGEYNKFVRACAHAVFTAICFLLFFHKNPAIINLKVFDAVYVGEHCTPFTMYLNMENGLIAGVLMCGFINIWSLGRSKERKWTDFFDSRKVIPLARTRDEWKQVFVSTGIYGSICIVSLMAAALVSGFVKFNPKFPPQTFWFLMNNLMLVCMAEEAFFRGYIQKHLTDFCEKRQISKMLALVVASIIFGLRHYQSGVIMIVLSTIAGLFYGAAYMRDNRIEAAILVHFGLNAAHFFFFSYPSFMR